MVFSSISFLFLFLPAVLLVYFSVALLTSVLKVRAQTPLLNVVLLISSLIFYAWGEPRLIVVIVMVALTDFTAALLISRGWYRRRVLITAIALNLGWLAFFKYANFGLENASGLAALAGFDPTGWDTRLDIALPLGISFYTFQSMSYTIDVYRGDVKATPRLLDFACMVTMFAHLVAGPIVRYRDLQDQLRQRAVTLPLFASGVQRFIIGLAKKTLIANSLAGPVDAIFSLPAAEVTTAIAWVGTCAYALQIYFDFSGYSDMAIGLARMFGLRFKENFNYPYVARSVTDFWRRWHISLSTWFRDYLYVPLGGNRGSAATTYRNLLIVFFLCGLWHGAQWTFVLWGLCHGAFLILERAGLGTRLAAAPVALRHAYTLLVVIAAWVLFRAPDLSTAAVFYRAMAGLAPGGLSIVGVYLVPTMVLAMIAGAVFSAPVVSFVASRARGLAEGMAADVARVGALTALFAGAIVSLASGTYNPFIYFRF